MKRGEPLPGISDEDWSATPLSVRRLVATMAETIVRLEKRVAELEERLGLNSSNSSKPPSSDPPSTPDTPKAPTGRPRGGQKGHPRHKRALLPSSMADRVVPCKPRDCGHCGSMLRGEDLAPERHQTFSLPAKLFHMIEYQLHSLACPCGHVTAAELPPEVDAGVFDVSVQALISLLSGRYRLSKRMIQEMMAEVFGIPISLGAVVDAEQRTSAALEVPYVEVTAHAQHAPILNADETSWREDKTRAWLWVMTTASVVVFMIHRNRNHIAAKQLLGEHFAGILGTDRYSGYTWVDLERRQLCWAHLKRDFQRMIDRGGMSARVGARLKRVAKSLFRDWHRVVEDPQRRAWFQRKVLGFRAEVWSALEVGTTCGHAKTEGTCTEMQTVFVAMWTFADVEGLDPTNNVSERRIRAGVIWRKVSFGTDSARGSRFVERILTAVMTLRVQGRAILAFLAQAIRAHLTGAASPSLLPVPS